MRKENPQEKNSIGLYEILPFPWQPVIHIELRQYTCTFNHISSCVHHRPTKSVPNDSLDIAHSCGIIYLN